MPHFFIEVLKTWIHLYHRLHRLHHLRRHQIPYILMNLYPRLLRLPRRCAERIYGSYSQYGDPLFGNSSLLLKTRNLHSVRNVRNLSQGGRDYQILTLVIWFIN